MLLLWYLIVMLPIYWLISRTLYNMRSAPAFPHRAEEVSWVKGLSDTMHNGWHADREAHGQMSTHPQSKTAVKKDSP